MSYINEVHREARLAAVDDPESYQEAFPVHYREHLEAALAACAVELRDSYRLRYVRTDMGGPIYRLEAL